MLQSEEKLLLANEKNTIVYLEERGSVGFVSMCSHQVFNGFLTCSPSSQCIPQHFPNISSHLSHIVQAQSSNLITYIIGPKEEIRTFLFWNYPKLKKMGQLKMSISHDHLQSSCTLGDCKGPILL
jgi:hypothetical protein